MAITNEEKASSIFMTILGYYYVVICYMTQGLTPQVSFEAARTIDAF